MIYSFYSFKGGVGRSMALANVAELFYRRKLSVLIVDFDLEAPGLERFFEGPETVSHADLLRSRGVLDLLLSYKTLRSLPVSAQTRTEASGAGIATGIAAAAGAGTGIGTGIGAALTGVPAQDSFAVEPLKNFIVPIYPDTGDGTSLSIMPAGRRDDDEYSLYADRIRAFNWEEFYVKWDGERFFDWFAREIESLADVVLIDSRTGITEMSGVCTHQLADAVALFVAPNQQNLDGIKRIAGSLTREELVTQGRKGRPLSLLIVPSRIEPGEGDKLDEFAALFEQELTGLIDPRLTFEQSAFVSLRIPYVQHYAYMETVAVREPDKPKAADLIAAYTRVSSALVELAPPTSRLYQTYHRPLQEQQAPPVENAIPAAAHFVGRDWALGEIVAWLGNPAPAVMAVTGDPGSGKSALLARFVETRQDPLAGGSHGRNEFIAIAYACHGGTGEPKQFVTALALNLAARYQEFAYALRQSVTNEPGATVKFQRRITSATTGHAPPVISIQSLDFGTLATDTIFRCALARPLQELYGGHGAFNESILVVIDGLDLALAQSADDNLLALVAMATAPRALPPQVRFLIGTRRDARVLLTIPGTQLNLSADRARGEYADTFEFAKGRLHMVPEPTRSTTARRLADEAQGNFLVVSVAIETILAGPMDHAAVTSRLQELLEYRWHPLALTEYWRRCVKQVIGFRTDRWTEQYRPFLSTLAVARDDLTLSQLAGIVGETNSVAADIARTVSQFLVGPVPPGPFRLFHPLFARFLLTDAEYGSDAAEAHERIARYFLGVYAKGWMDCEDTYAMVRTLWHLLRAHEETHDRRVRQELLVALMTLLGTTDFLDAVKARSLSARITDDLAEALALAGVQITGSEVRVPPAAPEYVRRAVRATVSFQSAQSVSVSEDGVRDAKTIVEQTGVERLAKSDAAEQEPESETDASVDHTSDHTISRGDRVTLSLSRRTIMTAVYAAAAVLALGLALAAWWVTRPSYGIRQGVTPRPDPLAMIALAYEERQENDPAAAIRTLNYALLLVQDPALDAQILRDRAFCYKLQDKWTESIADLTDVLKLMDRSASTSAETSAKASQARVATLNDRAFAYMQVRDLDAAIDDYDAAAGDLSAAVKSNLLRGFFKPLKGQFFVITLPAYYAYRDRFPAAVRQLNPPYFLNLRFWWHTIPQTELRYTLAGDKAEAEQLAKTLASRGFTVPAPMLMPARTPARPRRIELWLGADSRSAR
jgi:hypothetical protein